MQARCWRANLRGLLEKGQFMPSDGKNKISEETGIPPLRHIYFYLTEGCNLRCRHCWLAPRYDPEGKKFDVLPVQLFQAAIQEAKPLGLNGIKLTGGEPLLHPEFPRLLEIARNHELSVTIETNGVLCTPEVAARIAEVPNRFVSVSLDGADAETHDWVRGVDGSFEGAVSAIRNLVAADTRPQVIMTLMRCNVDQIDSVVTLAESLGASSVKFNLVQPAGRGCRVRDQAEGLSVPEAVELGRFVDMELSRRTPLKLHFDYPLAFRPLSRVAQPGGCAVCGVLSIIGVIPSGQYALCGRGEHVQDLVFGAVGEGTLPEIWRDSPILKTLRDGLPDKLEGICSRCLMKGTCLGACVAQNYYDTGSLWGPYWFCREAERTGIFPETRILTAARAHERSRMARKGTFTPEITQ